MESELQHEPLAKQSELSSLQDGKMQIEVVLQQIQPEDTSEAVIEKVIGELWYRLLFVTLKKSEGHFSSLPDRFQRMNKAREIKAIRKEYQGLDPDEKEFYATDYYDFRESSKAEYKRFKKNEEEFSDQKTLTVKNPDWDDITANYTILNRDASRDKPPIVYIGGASNGIESSDSFVRKMAERYPDRQVIVLGYPDAASRGVVTEKFYDAVKNDEGVKPHAQFFEAEINHLIPDGKFELMGHSTAALIIESFPSQFLNRVSDIVLMCPAGSVDIPTPKFYKGIIADFTALITNIKNTPNYVFLNDPSKGDQKKWKFGIFEEFGKRARKAFAKNLLPSMKVNSETKIAVISTASDQVTFAQEYYSPKNLDTLKAAQPNINIDILPGPHSAPFLDPEKFLTAIDKMLGR